MSSTRASIVAATAFAFGIGLLALACQTSEDHPPATNGSVEVTSSSGAGGSSSTGSSGSSGKDGSAADTGTTSSSGTTSSGGSSGTQDSGVIATGLRASINGAAAVYDTAPTAQRQLSGSVVVLSGTDATGNSLQVTVSVATGMVAAGTYTCDGDAGTPGASITYTATGGADIWEAVGVGDCTVDVQSIDNQAGGVAVGTFTGTAKKAGSADKAITNGQFRLTF